LADLTEIYALGRFYSLQIVITCFITQGESMTTLTFRVAGMLEKGGFV
jgi:hypothetical protein